MKYYIKLTVLASIICICCYSQEGIERKTQNVLRINFLNPGVEYEFSLGQFSTLSFGTGVGYGGAYPDLTEGSVRGTQFNYIISPFLDVQKKWFYNFSKRIEKGKATDNNSGNFISLRLVVRGESIKDNVTRTSYYDYAIGPTWGIQRKWGSTFHVLFDVGPQYYFDLNGKGNFIPFMIQLNLGFDL